MKPTLAGALAAAALASFPAPATAADTYLVAKLGYFGPTAEVVATGGNVGQLDPRFYWELGVGMNASFLGLELSGGRFSSTNATLQLTTSSIPVLLSVRLRIPIPVFTPYIELGGGAFFNDVEIPGLFSESHTTWGYLAGGGIDFRFSSLLIGVEARYLSAEAGIPYVTLRVDGVTVTGNLGFYF